MSDEKQEEIQPIDLSSEEKTHRMLATVFFMCSDMHNKIKQMERMHSWNNRILYLFVGMFLGICLTKLRRVSG